MLWCEHKVLFTGSSSQRAYICIYNYIVLHRVANSYTESSPINFDKILKCEREILFVESGS